MSLWQHWRKCHEETAALAHAGRISEENVNTGGAEEEDLNTCGAEEEGVNTCGAEEDKSTDLETLLPLGLIMIFLYLTPKLIILIADLYSPCFLDRNSYLCICVAFSR